MRADLLKLSWKEIGFLCEGITSGSRTMRGALRTITDEYALGPRGAWILILITTGQVSPSDFTRVFHVGRSLITTELAALTEARLITYCKTTSDRRRVELALASLGEGAVKRIKRELSKLVIQRLSAYTREEVLLCTRMLHDFIAAEPQRGGAQLDSRRQAPGKSA
jgi:DNA-binding MarR family transcriptional regulator